MCSTRTHNHSFALRLTSRADDAVHVTRYLFVFAVVGFCFVLQHHPIKCERRTMETQTPSHNFSKTVSHLTTTSTAATARRTRFRVKREYFLFFSFRFARPFLAGNMMMHAIAHMCKMAHQRTNSVQKRPLLCPRLRTLRAHTKLCVRRDLSTHGTYVRWLKVFMLLSSRRRQTLSARTDKLSSSATK